MATQLAQVEPRITARRVNLRTALLALRWQCRQPHFGEDEERFAGVIGALAELAPQQGAHELASAATAVAQEPSDTAALRGLGRRLVDAGLFDVAIPVLSRARHLERGCASVLTELAFALEAEGSSDLAMQMLLAETESLESSFLCRHLLAHNALMAGCLQAARGFAEVQLPTTEAEAAMASRVLEMIERANTMTGTTSLDDDDLRGWHFVMTGGLLLHLSPYGQDVGMRGRYGVLADSYERIRYCLQRLRWTLFVLGFEPPRIMAADDVGSLGLATAVAKLLGVPVARIDGNPGLIVVHDTACLSEESMEAVSCRTPGQMLYAHATCWTEPSIAPDLGGLLYQGISAPWALDSRQMPSEPPISRRSLNSAVAGPLVDRIIHAEPGGLRLAPGDTDQRLVRFVSAARPFVGRYCMGDRPRMPAAGGPVKSPTV